MHHFSDFAGICWSRTFIFLLQTQSLLSETMCFYSISLQASELILYFSLPCDNLFYFVNILPFVFFIIGKHLLEKNTHVVSFLDLSEFYSHVPSALLKPHYRVNVAHMQDFVRLLIYASIEVRLSTSWIVNNSDYK